MTKVVMVTTVDNPYDPFDDYKSWHNWDTSHGYHTASFLARLTFYSQELTEESKSYAVELAVDEMVRENISGVYKKISREVPDTSGV